MKKGEIKESFYDFCISNDLDFYLDIWDKEKNSVSPKEVSKYSKEKIFFKCPICNKSEAKFLTTFVLKKEPSYDCTYCNSFYKWLLDNLGKEYIDKYVCEDSLSDILVLSYGGTKKKVHFKCTEVDYHDYYVTPRDFATKGRRCSFCGNLQTHHLDSIGNLYPSVVDVWSDKNKFSPYEVRPSSMKKTYLKCENGRHGDYCGRLQDLVKVGLHCPMCIKEQNTSILQSKVEAFLLDSGYKIKKERECSILPKNPLHSRTNHFLPFDIEVEELRLIIEINGIQHYKENNGFTKQQAKKKGTTIKEEFEYSVWKDNFKKNYAISKGYYYIAIPYWMDNEEQCWKNFLSNYIISIKENGGK